MGMGHTPTQQPLMSSTVAFCDSQLSASSIYRYLYEHGHRLFPDEAFADLFKKLGRDSIPPQIVAVVMVLQRLEGLSDREAVNQFTFNLRWKYAAGGLDCFYPGFVHTVLVRMRARLRNSDAPGRIFQIVLDVAKQCGVVGRKRVLDSTPIYDAVATQDTVTLIRSAIRGLLRVADADREKKLRKVLKRDDTYLKPGKPECDWNDAAAREALIDALCKDAHALLEQLHDCQLPGPVAQAAELLATVVDQDTERTPDERFRIARKVTRNRVISTVDPEARHGHKSKARKFDGYKGHISVEPDSEIITATAVTPANAGDASVAPLLVKDVLQDPDKDTASDGATDADADIDADSNDDERGPSTGHGPDGSLPPQSSAGSAEDGSSAGQSDESGPVEIYGDASYGTAEFVAHCEDGGADTFLKVQPPSSRSGQFSKALFLIELDRHTVTCPAQHTVEIKRYRNGSGRAEFRDRCKECPLRAQCTSSSNGRVINIHPRERTLQKERRKQRDSAEWRAKYKATRPKVERKFGHMTRRRHGGRRARVRGCQRIAQDFAMLAAALNLQRLANLRVNPIQTPSH